MAVVDNASSSPASGEVLMADDIASVTCELNFVIIGPYTVICENANDYALHGSTPTSQPYDLARRNARSCLNNVLTKQTPITTQLTIEYTCCDEK